MHIVKMATRHLIRNWHRTLVTSFAMAFACFIMILFAALMEGMLAASERNAVVMDVADIQVHEQGYREDQDLYTTIKNPSQLIQQISQAGFYASPRLHGFALAAAGTSSSGVQLRGINIQREAEVTQIHKHVMMGKWLSDDDPDGVVIGKKLARTLNIKPGDELVIIGQASDGSMANALYRVRGVLKSVGSDIDGAGFFMLDSAFRELMVFDDGIHEIAVMRADREMDLEQATTDISELAPGLEVLNWRQIRPVIARILDMADTQMLVFILITYIAMAMVVLNAMLMSVFERIHEFGIMKAIGVKPGQIVALIYMETFLQALFAMMCALLSGWYVANYYQHQGIDFTDLASSASFGGIAMEPIWYAKVTADVLITPAIFMFLIAMLAVIYPAVKAAVIEPVKAIYYR